MTLETFYILAVDRFTAEPQYPQRRKRGVCRNRVEETTKGRRDGMEYGDPIGTHPFGQRRKSLDSEIIRKQRSAIQQGAIHVPNGVCRTTRMTQRQSVVWRNP